MSIIGCLLMPCWRLSIFLLFVMAILISDDSSKSKPRPFNSRSIGVGLFGEAE